MARARFWADKKSRDWSYAMPRQPDNEMRATIQAKAKNGKSFLVVMNGQDQWFTVSSNNNVVCPEKGMDVIIKYNVTPASEGYEDRGPTYWANAILNPALVEQNGADLAVDVDKPTGRGAYDEAQQQAADRVSESPEPKKADLTFDEREALKNDGYNRRAALNAAVEVWKSVDPVPTADILGQYARNLYNATFNPPEEVGGYATEHSAPTPGDDPGPQPD